MIAYVALSALLYVALLYPLKEYSFFAANADYFRIAMCIPVAFSFLFGPAAAWGAALGNILFDGVTGLSWIAPFGFLGNFLIAYVPYKLWSRLTNETPDFRSIKKLGLFVGLCALGCALAGLIIGWGLLLLFSFPFAMTSFTIFASDLLWAILLGPVVLAPSYGFFAKHKLLYTDILHIQAKASWTKNRSLTAFVGIVCVVLCLAIPQVFIVDVWVLFPFVVAAFLATIIACR